MIFSGGKGITFKRLVNLMPPHEVYIETHLGGGAVIRNKRLAKHNIGIEIDPKVLAMWNAEDKNSFEIIEGDGVQYLKEYPFIGNEMVYCDPPYLRETRKRKRKFYIFEYTYEQHVELLEVIKRLPCMVMISGYESDLYQEMLKGWHVKKFQSKTHSGVATEWLWMNYPAPSELHDYRYLGNNFRERENIKRKQESWVSRLNAMPVLERQALLLALRNNVNRER
jgi:site-specific DNA-adenine methylase